MSDDGSKDSELKVEDRRTSAKGGEEIGTQAGSEAEPAAEPVAEKRAEKNNGDLGSPGTSGSRTNPKVDFSTFVFSLFSSALIQLGDMADPVTGEKNPERNLDAVSQTIDLLDLLREKTEGNLTEDETSLIKESTSQLKFKYFDAVKGKG